MISRRSVRIGRNRRTLVLVSVILLINIENFCPRRHNFDNSTASGNGNRQDPMCGYQVRPWLIAP
jgi:hypothetical protein